MAKLSSNNSCGTIWPIDLEDREVKTFIKGFSLKVDVIANLIIMVFLSWTSTNTPRRLRPKHV